MKGLIWTFAVVICLCEVICEDVKNDTTFNTTTAVPVEVEMDVFEFVTEGVLLTTISAFGFIGNSLSIYVLLRPTVRGTFSNILTGLATFDALFLVLAILTFGLPTLDGEYYGNVFFPHIAPVCYGLIHTFRVGSAFATLSVTVERFFAIVFPLKDFRCVKKWLLPSTAIFTVVYNIPKFFEVHTVTDPETNETRIEVTAMRNNPIYVSVYVVWGKLILTELVPYFTILILNSFIITKIIKSARFRSKVIKNHEGKSRPSPPSNNSRAAFLSPDFGRTRSRESVAIRQSNNAQSVDTHPMHQQRNTLCPNSMRYQQIQQQRSPSMAFADRDPQARSFFDKQRQEHRLGILLVGISVLFILCQSFKIIPDVYEVIFCESLEECDTTPFIDTCTNLSHLLVCVNSAANCIIYLMVGEKFRRIWCDTFCPTQCRRSTDCVVQRDGIPLQTWTFSGGCQSRMSMSVATTPVLNTTIMSPRPSVCSNIGMSPVHRGAGRRNTELSIPNDKDRAPSSPKPKQSGTAVSITISSSNSPINHNH